jgi:dipeptide transport system permease protein
MALLKKLFDLIPSLIGVSLLAFLIIRLVPGDPVLLLLGERGGNPTVYNEMKKNLGLDQPLYKQYFSFVTGALRGDLGKSIHSKRSVWEEFSDRFPATFELGTTALILATIFGIPLGVWAAKNRGKKIDYLFMSGSLIGYSMPIFWWGLILIIIFSVKLGLTPVSGRLSALYDIPNITGLFLIDSWFSSEPLETFINSLSHMILPAIVLGTIPLAVIARMTRSAVLETLGEDYIRTARAKGLSEEVVLWKHALKNALIPIITVIGVMFGTIITGAILTETIFSWPGIGKWMVASIGARDYPVIQGGILILASIIIFINAIVDYLYVLVNPKMRKK